MLGKTLSVAAFVVLTAVSSAAQAVVASTATIKIDVFTGDPAAAESTWNRLGGASLNAAIGPDGTFGLNPADTSGHGFALSNVAMAGDSDPFLTWAMILAGIIGVAGIARRRINSL
jgi:hypothetical protein